MIKHREISIEEILANADPEGYRVDGFHLLARMIARRYMSEGRPDQMYMNGDMSTPDDLNEGEPRK